MQWVSSWISGAYGNAWISTPNLDRLASEGVVFDHHFAENLTTLPTRRSWWTGRYGFPLPEMGWEPLRHDETILPDLLWNQGVKTAFVSDVPMLRQSGHGFGRGFDEVCWVRGSGYDPFISADDPRAAKVNLAEEPGFPKLDPEDPDFALWKDRWEQVLRNRAALGTHVDENTGVARTVEAAVDWLERRATENPKTARPFLLWVDLLSPHGPWDLPPEDRDRYATLEPDEFETGDEGDLVEEVDEGEADLQETRVLIDVPASAVGDALDEVELLRLRRTYAGAVTMTDRWLGKLLEVIKATDKREPTLVIFTSDQGEPLGEHGYVRRFRPWLYEELIHTPLIVRMPGGERGGMRHHAIVQPVDLFTTVLSAFRLPKLAQAHGGNLLSLINGEQTQLRDYACMGMDVEEFAIRTHLWHLILPIDPDPEDVPRGVELYRKPEDRWEQNNVVEEYVETAEHLELTLRRFAEAVGRDAIEDLPRLRTFVRYGSA